MQTESRSIFPLANLGTPALVVLVGALFAGTLYSPSYKSARPPSRALATDVAGAPAIAPALSTQDPLQVAHDHAIKLKFPGWDHRVPGVEVIRDEFAQRCTSKKTLVLLAGMRAGPWPEDRERRVRTRYAVTSALARANFQSDMTRQLAFVAADLGRPSIVPFDWYERDAAKQPVCSEFEVVLCLWLDEAVLEVKPVARLYELLDAVIGGSNADVTASFLGPTNSGLLLRMLEDAQEVDRAAWLPRRQQSLLTAVSPMATVAFELGSEREQASIRHCEGSQPSAMKLVRTIGRDDELAELLLLELAERIPALMRWTGGEVAWPVETRQRMTECAIKHRFGGSEMLKERLLLRGLAYAVSAVKFAPPRKLPVTVALVSEQDTEYGWRWCDTFERARVALSKRNPLFHALEFEFVRYSSVIDGAALGEAAHDPSSSADLERAGIGPGQVDYLRRVEEQLRRGRRIDAIGVLGTDVYDTLMILQALRRSFRDAVVFTTDSDARLLQPEHLPYTRNVIVASHFDLGVGDETLRFRDSYQTATYGALRDLLGGRVQSWADSRRRPRLFEIGRGVAVELNTPGMLRKLPEQKGQIEPDGAVPRSARSVMLDLADAVFAGNEVQAGEHAQALASDKPERWKLLWLGISVLAVIGVVVIVGHKPGAFSNHTYAQRMRRGAWFVIAPVALFVALLAGAHWVDRMSREYPAEPLDAFVGVSVWPSVLIRAACSLFCAWAIVSLRAELVKEHRRARQDFALGSCDASKSLRLFWRWLLGVPSREGLSSLSIVEAWTCMDRWLANWRWLCGRLLLYVVVCHFVVAPFFMRSNTVPPVRGEFAYLIERISIWSSVWMFFALVCYVLETSFISHRLMHRIADPKATALPNEYRKREASALGISREQADRRGRTLLIQRVTTAADSMVYYPAVAVAAIVLARADILDNWSWSAVLAGTLATFFLLLLLCVLNSHRIASRERTKTLSFLRSERLLRADDPVQRDRIEQLRLEIEGLRSGAFAPMTEHPLVRSAFLPLIAWASAGLIDQGVVGSLLQKM